MSGCAEQKGGVRGRHRLGLALIDGSIGSDQLLVAERLALSKPRQLLIT